MMAIADSLPVGHWQVHEVTQHNWWVIDNRTGTAFGMDRPRAEQLWKRHDLLEISLGEALRRLDGSSSDLSFLDLRLLDTTTRFVGDEGMVAAVKYLFGGACSALRSSPNFVAELAEDADIERLHRSVDGPRPGISVRRVGDARTFAPDAFPAWPPLQSMPFAGRFAALHAALLETPRGAITVCGGQRAGKTTASLVAEHWGYGSILTDELILLDQCGLACGVPLPIRERNTHGRQARPIERTPETGRLVRVSALVVLAPTQDRPAVTRLDDTAETLSLIAPHLRPLATSLGAATANLIQLIRSCECWHWGVRPWPELEDDLQKALGQLLGAA